VTTAKPSPQPAGGQAPAVMQCGKVLEGLYEQIPPQPSASARTLISASVVLLPSLAQVLPFGLYGESQPIEQQYLLDGVIGLAQ